MFSKYIQNIQRPHDQLKCDTDAMRSPLCPKNFCHNKIQYHISVAVYYNIIWSVSPGWLWNDLTPPSLKMFCRGCWALTLGDQKDTFLRSFVRIVMFSAEANGGAFMIYSLKCCILQLVKLANEKILGKMFWRPRKTEKSIFLKCGYYTYWVKAYFLL